MSGLGVGQVEVYGNWNYNIMINVDFANGRSIADCVGG
jgi:hypothetical protein